MFTFRGYRSIVVISGGRDEFADPRELEREAKRRFLDVRVEIVAGADHFFTDHLDELEERVRDFASRLSIPGAVAVGT